MTDPPGSGRKLRRTAPPTPALALGEASELSRWNGSAATVPAVSAMSPTIGRRRAGLLPPRGPSSEKNSLPPIAGDARFGASP
jgi:hypothetical protein